MTTLKTHGDVALELQLTGADALRTLVCGGKPWSAFASELEVRDDFRNRIYLGSQAECQVLDTEIVYTWRDADFVLRETWREDDDAFKRVISIELAPGAPERSITLMELIPFPESVYGWTMWTAFESFPSDMQWIGWRKMYYGDLCYGTVLPCMSFYNRGQDRGILLGVPHGELPGGRLAFTSRDYHCDGIEVEFSNLLLTDRHPVVCPLVIAGQLGDYRCTLAFWKKRFPEYFARVVERPQEDAGPFLMTHPEFEESEVDRLCKNYSPAWAEVHNHFSKYGEYAPEADEWESVIRRDYPKSWTGKPMTRAKINRHIDKLHENQVLAMLYIQCYGDCLIPYAEAEFPEDIARDIAGNHMPTWIECCFVAPLPGTKFRKHVLSQIDRFLKVYPDIDGVFLDQLCYQAVDFAHEDGKSAYRNRRVSNYGDSCFETLYYLCDKLHAQGRTVWANGPFNLDAAKPVDGMMSEGSGTIARTVQYMTIGSKSLLVAAYAASATDVEKMFRHCLVCGANYSIAGSFDKTKIPEYSERINFILQKCGRLTKLLAGCQWVLTAHPFKLPEAFEGNLFTLPDGTLALTIVSRQGTLVHGDVACSPEFEVEVKSSESISSAIEYSVYGDTVLTPEVADGKIKLKVPGHAIFSVILLKR